MDFNYFTLADTGRSSEDHSAGGVGAPEVWLQPQQGQGASQHQDSKPNLPGQQTQWIS